MFDKTRECTGSFNCRFKAAIIISIVVVIAAILGVVLFGDSLATS